MTGWLIFRVGVGGVTGARREKVGERERERERRAGKALPYTNPPTPPFVYRDHHGILSSSYHPLDTLFFFFSHLLWR